MANQVEQTLTNSLYEYLQRERYVTIATVDFETNGPNVNAISWIYAKNQFIIYLAIDNRSRMVQNIKNNSLVVVTIVANESTYSISGEAIVKADKIENVPLKLALIELRIKEVRDVMFYGSKISTEPKYEKTYDLNAAERLDNQVMDALKKA